METIRETLARKLKRAKRGLNILMICMGISLLFFYGAHFANLPQLLGIVFIFIGFPFACYSGFIFLFMVKCPNCRKSLSGHITYECTTNYLAVRFPKEHGAFSVSTAKIKECPFCNINLDTPMDQVKGVKLIPPEYKSFHVYREEKPYTKVEKENKKAERIRIDCLTNDKGEP